MEGYLFKRKARLHRWTSRYFILNGKKLVYKVKYDSPNNRSEFDLAEGCIVTDVTEDSKGGKKLFSIWLIWPQEDDQTKPQENTDNSNILPEDSDDDDNEKVHASSNKHLKQVIQNEVISLKQHHKQQQIQIEKEIELHKAHDQSIGVGAKIAALAVGGVIVGAFTFGIGLIPSLTVVSVAAASGGAVALQIRKPVGSRLILASESLDEILSWKNCIEKEISKLDRIKKPLLPTSSDASVISSIIGMSTDGKRWHNVGVIEGMRILEQTYPLTGTRCRKAQVLVRNTPIKTFLSIMESNNWPVGGEIKVLKVIDDHADIIEATVHTKCKANPMKSSTRTFLLSRFWRLEDDGIYLVTLNTITEMNFEKMEDTEKKDIEKCLKLSKSKNTPSFDVVITVAPRKDHMEYDNDISLALITCTCQLSSDTKCWMNQYELEAFMNDYFAQQLLDLKQDIEIHKYQLLSHGKSKKPSSPSAQLIYSKFSFDNESLPTTGKFEKPSLIRSQTLDSRIIRQNSIGISNIQPGEEISPIKSKIKQLTVEPTSLFKKNLFKRGVKNIQPVNTISPSNYGLSLSTPTSIKDENNMIRESKKSNYRFSGQRKSTKINPEASSLRGQIAAKEYEVQRIEKLLKKKGAIITNEGLNINNINNFINNDNDNKKLKDDISIENEQIKEIKKVSNKMPNHWTTSYSTSRQQYFFNLIDRNEEINVILQLLSIFIITLVISLYLHELLQEI